MTRHLPSYLHTLRKQWGLSQPDLATLFNITASALSRFETLSRQPTIEIMIGAEVIFGHTAKDVFPKLYREIERVIVQRAHKSLRGLEKRNDPASLPKRRLLVEIIERASQPPLDV